jgi:hypothetical protein
MMLAPNRRHRPLHHGTRVVAAAVVSLATVVAPGSAAAQKPIMGEGALDLLLPTGARSVSVGQATMAVAGTTESVWWNPSGLASMRGTTAAIHHSQSPGGSTADAVSVVTNSRLLGSFGVSASLRDLGQSTNADAGGAEAGTILPRTLIYAATYAASVERLNVGLSYKLVQFRIDCTGPCTDDAAQMASSSALDAGAQYSFEPKIPITFGASVRNLGVKLQVNDQAQSDDLPTRMQAGLELRVPGMEDVLNGAELRVSADMVSELGRVHASPRVGAELGWHRRIRIRGGYASTAGGFGGPSLGVGYEAGSLAIDFARMFVETTSVTGTEPVYLSLRYRF